jgi:hypothetical protein
MMPRSRHGVRGESESAVRDSLQRPRALVLEFRACGPEGRLPHRAAPFPRGWETIIVFGMLSVIMQLLFWSKIVDPGNRRTRRG